MSTNPKQGCTNREDTRDKAVIMSSNEDNEGSKGSHSTKGKRRGKPRPQEDEESEGGNDDFPPTNTNELAQQTSPRGDLEKAIKRLKGGETFARAVKEMKWQGTGQREKKEARDEYREKLITREYPVVLAGMRLKQPFLQVIHSPANFHADPLDDDEYDGACIGFMDDRTNSTTPNADQDHGENDGRMVKEDREHH